MLLKGNSINNVRPYWLNDAEVFKEDCIILWFPVIFIELLHRHSSDIYQSQRTGKESFQIGLSEEKDNIISVSGTSAGNVLTFSQVFFGSLTQVYMSSKITATLKGKKNLFTVCQSTR